jgi:hypothetical protein
MPRIDSCIDEGDENNKYVVISLHLATDKTEKGA